MSGSVHTPSNFWKRFFSVFTSLPGWRAQLCTLVGLLLLCQCLLLSAIGVEAGIALIRSRTDLRLEIVPGVSNDTVQHLYQELRAISGIEHVQYISSQEAQAFVLEKDPPLARFLEQFNITTPFPSFMHIRLRELGDYPAVLSSLRASVASSIVAPQSLSLADDQELHLASLLSLVNGVHSALLFSVLIAVIIFLCALMTLVRLRIYLSYHAVECAGMMGASTWCVLQSYFYEVLIFLFSGFVLSLLLLAVIFPLFHSFITPLSDSEWSKVFLDLFTQSSPFILFSEILVLAALAFLTTLFALYDCGRQKRAHSALH